MGNDQSVPIPHQKFTLYIPPFKAPFQGNLGKGIKSRITDQLCQLETNRRKSDDTKSHPHPEDWILFDPQTNTLIDRTMVQNAVQLNHSYLVLSAHAASGDELWETVDKYLPGPLRAALLKKRFEADTYPSPSDGSENSENDGVFRTPDHSVTSDLIDHTSGGDAITRQEIPRRKSPPPKYDHHKS